MGATITHHEPHGTRQEQSSWPTVRHVPVSEPFRWLALGLRDLKRTPGASLMYGLLFVFAGYAMLGFASMEPRLVLTFVTSFLLIGTFLSIGFYELSHRLEDGKTAHLGHALSAWRHNPVTLAAFALVLGLTVGIWFRASALIVGMFFGSVELAINGWGSFMQALLNGQQGLAFVTTFMATGALLAIFAFSISVVSIPMINARQVDVVTAIVTSIRAVKRNPAAMAVWAGLIALLIGAGMATLMIGLLFTLPLIGHASWHAYRRIVEDENLPAA